MVPAIVQAAFLETATNHLPASEGSPGFPAILWLALFGISPAKPSLVQLLVISAVDCSFRGN
jgi:hypothetical protein